MQKSLVFLENMEAKMSWLDEEFTDDIDFEDIEELVENEIESI